MGRLPLSPATSFGGPATLEHLTDMSLSMSNPKPCVAPGDVHGVLGPDYSRYHAHLPAEGMSPYAPNVQQPTPPIGPYCGLDVSAGGVYGAEKGRDSYASYAYSPCTPEMSPRAVADDVITTRSGLNILKRPRSADSHQGKPSKVEKRRKPSKGGTKPVTLQKHVALQRPLSEVIRETANVEVFDVFAHVHRHNDVRKKEAEKEGKVKRPLNAFLLYRKHVIGFVKKELLTEENKNSQQCVSRICGDSWKMETDEVKIRFKQLAHAEKIRHGQAFPTYKYTPKPGKKPDGDDSRKPERSRPVAISSSPLTAPSGSISSPQMMAGPGQYSFAVRPEALGTKSTTGQNLYSEDGYYGPLNLESVFYYYSRPLHEVGHGWNQEVPGAAGNCAPAPYSQVQLPISTHMHGVLGPSADFHIDPLLMQEADETGYQCLARDDGLQDQHGWQSCGRPANAMAILPDLDGNGAHNAYLRGGHEDWCVEQLDDNGAFSDWLAPDEGAGT